MQLSKSDWFNLNEIVSPDDKALSYDQAVSIYRILRFCGFRHLVLDLGEYDIDYKFRFGNWSISESELISLILSKRDYSLTRKGWNQKRT